MNALEKRLKEIKAQYGTQEDITSKFTPLEIELFSKLDSSSKFINQILSIVEKQQKQINSLEKQNQISKQKSGEKRNNILLD